MNAPESLQLADSQVLSPLRLQRIARNSFVIYYLLETRIESDTYGEDHSLSR
jgi:hypothetical protein